MKPPLAGEGRARNCDKGITPEEVACITWDSLPTIKAEPVVLEPKPLFEITGGGRGANKS